MESARTLAHRAGQSWTLLRNHVINWSDGRNQASFFHPDTRTEQRHAQRCY